MFRLRQARGLVRCVAAAGASLVAAVPPNVACEPHGKPSGGRVFARRWNDPAEPMSPAAVCVARVKGWEQLRTTDLVVTELGGGASGQLVCKVALKDPSGTVSPNVVMYKECDRGGVAEGELDISSLALATFSKDQEDQNFCGKVYLAGAPAHPGVVITEFASGSMIEVGHLYDDALDGQSYGRLLGLLHAHQSDWFTPDKAEPSWMSSVLAYLPPDVLHKHLDDAKQDIYGSMILTNTAAMRAWGSLGAGELRGLHEALAPEHFSSLTTTERKDAQEWLLLAADVCASALDLSDQGSGDLMDRLVVAHGDAHSKQFIHREADAGKLLMVDFDMMLKAPAFYDWGCIPIDWYFTSRLGGHPYASLAKRREAAEAYLDSVGPPAAHYNRNTVDDIVFDANKGVVARLVFSVWITVIQAGLKQNFGAHGFGESYPSWLCLVLASKAARTIQLAKVDPELKALVLEKGVLMVAFDDDALNAFCLNPTPENAAKLSDIPLGPLVG